MKSGLKKAKTVTIKCTQNHTSHKRRLCLLQFRKGPQTNKLPEESVLSFSIYILTQWWSNFRHHLAAKSTNKDPHMTEFRIPLCPEDLQLRGHEFPLALSSQTDVRFSDDLAERKWSSFRHLEAQVCLLSSRSHTWSWIQWTNMYPRTKSIRWSIHHHKVLYQAWLNSSWDGGIGSLLVWIWRCKMDWWRLWMRISKLWLPWLRR